MFKNGMIVIGLALALGGCGSDKKASAEESAAASKIVGPMMAKNGSSANGVGMAQNVRNMRAISSYLAANVGTLDTTTTDPCGTITDSFKDLEQDVTCVKNSCSFTANTSLALDVSCTSSKAYKFTCSSIDYTAKSLTYSIVMSASQSALSLKMGFGLNLTGGVLTGTGDLACTVNLNLTSASTAADISADALSCKYDGKTIDADQLKANYSANSTDCTETEQTLN